MEEERTRINWLSFDACSPATPVLTSGNLDELGGKLHIVLAILDDLYAAFSSVELCPSIAVEVVTLITRMPCL